MKVSPGFPTGSAEQLGIAAFRRIRRENSVGHPLSPLGPSAAADFGRVRIGGAAIRV